MDGWMDGWMKRTRLIRVIRVIRLNKIIDVALLLGTTLFTVFTSDF